MSVIENKDQIDSVKSKIESMIRIHDWGMISGIQLKYSSHENRQRTTSLIAKLRALRYSVSAIQGTMALNCNSNNEYKVEGDVLLVVDIMNLRHTLFQFWHLSVGCSDCKCVWL